MTRMWVSLETVKWMLHTSGKCPCEPSVQCCEVSSRSGLHGGGSTQYNVQVSLADECDGIGGVDTYMHALDSVIYNGPKEIHRYRDCLSDIILNITVLILV
jgi:hypothetical protein